MSPVEILTAHLLGQLASSATSLTENLVAPVIESRARARADAAALERRRAEIEAEQQAADSDAERQRTLIDSEIARHREIQMDARYPLGQPGKLQQLLPSGVAPCLLVSPTHRAGSVAPMAIADIVADIVGQVDSSGQLLRVVTVDFAHDAGRPREISGNMGAAEIARFEFDPRPSIIVRFAGTASALTAHARMTHLIRTVHDEAAFETPVARLVGNQLEFAAWRDPETESAAHLAWASEAVGGSDGADPYTALGTAIAVFAVSISSVYWSLQGVRWRIDRPALEPLNDVFHAGAELVTRESALTERLNQELAELAATHTDVEVFDWEGEELVGVYVPRPPRAVTFVVGREYPTVPPGVLLRDANGDIKELKLDASQWKPSRSLTDLLGAFE